MPRLGRRHFLAGCGTLPLATHTAAWAAEALPPLPASNRLAFDVSRKGSKIGTHTLAFTPSGSTLTVQIAADFAIGIGPITLYRYKLRATETWENGVLAALNADTNDDGDKAWVRAKRIGGALHVDGSKSGRYVALPESIAATHWNRDELRAPMINPQNGELLHFRVADHGAEPVATAAGTVRATHYALTGPATLDLWYDTDGVWAALHAVAKDGSLVTYERTEGGRPAVSATQY